MNTECTQIGLGFHPLNERAIRAQFDGGAISSDGGGLLLREVEKRVAIIHGFAACFTDYRNAERIEHQLEELVAQRVYALALGYEDLNDHEQLRNDPLLAVLVEKSWSQSGSAGGQEHVESPGTDSGHCQRPERYKKIVLDHEAVDRLLVDVFLRAHGEAPEEIILDLDATDDPVHGQQEGRFFHGYYGHYCYLPLYIFLWRFFMGARLRRPTSMERRAAWPSCSGSCHRFAAPGRRCALSYGEIQDFAARN